MVTETSTESGTARSIGIKSASNGTATSDSPKPKAERNTVARKIIRETAKMTGLADMTKDTNQRLFSPIISPLIGVLNTGTIKFDRNIKTHYKINFIFHSSKNIGHSQSNNIYLASLY